MKKISLLLIFASFISMSQIKAQTNLTSLQYSIGFTSGDFNKFIGDVSFRGFNFDYRKLIQPNVGVGIEFGWNIFNEKKDYASYSEGTQTISGVQYRYCSTVPILASADYYLKPGEDINPFIGLSAGTMYSRNDLDMGLYTLYKDVWHFAWKPEIGVIVKVNPEMGFIVAAKYYNALKTDDIASRNYLGANVGLVWEY